MSRKFTILGEMGSGKTCYLVGMYVEMTCGIENYSISMPNDAEAKRLARFYRKLKDPKSGADRFPEASQESATYQFILNDGTHRIMVFDWIDYPGEWTDVAVRPEAGNKLYEQYQQVERSINESSALFICMDGENLKGKDVNKKIRKVKMNCALHISNYITRLFGELNQRKQKLPPIGIIVTKWDLCRDTTDEKQLKEIVQGVFQPLFNATDTVISVIPVSIGDTIMDNDCKGEFDPINVELPILYGIRYALEDAIKEDEARISQNNSDCSRTVSDKETYISGKRGYIRSKEDDIDRWDTEKNKEIDCFITDWDYVNDRRRWIENAKGYIEDARSEIAIAESAIKSVRAERDRKNNDINAEISQKRNRINTIKRALSGITLAFYDGIWHEGIK